MLMMYFDQLEVEHKILLMLFIMTYFGAMFIQIKDPKANVAWSDWVLGFICSLSGGIIAYYAVTQWVNVGMRMAVTILATLVSYRTMKFIVSSEAQDEFARGFWKGVVSAIQRLLNSPRQEDRMEEREDNNRKRRENDEYES